MCTLYKSINKFLKFLGAISLLSGVGFGLFGIISLIFNGINEQDVTYVGYGIEYLLYVTILITYGLMTINIFVEDVKEK